MRSDLPEAIRRRLSAHTLVLVLGSVASAVAAATPVYKCDRSAGEAPCPNIAGPTPAQVAAAAEDQRRQTNAAQARRDARRADEQLLRRYPNEAVHRTAEVAALQAVASNIGAARARFDATVDDCRQPFAEAAFYPDGKLPPWLRERVDQCDALFDAQKNMFLNLAVDVASTVERFRVERDRLRPLWAGATPP